MGSLEIGHGGRCGWCSRELLKGQFPGTLLGHHTSVTTPVDYHHDQLSHPFFRLRILVRFFGRRSIAYRWHDGPQPLRYRYNARRQDLFFLAGQVSTRVRPQHRIWTKPDEGISSPFGLVSVSAFSAVRDDGGAAESRGIWHTSRKGSTTTTPPMSVLFNPCRPVLVAQCCPGLGVRHRMTKIPAFPPVSALLAVEQIVRCE